VRHIPVAHSFGRPGRPEEPVLRAG